MSIIKKHWANLCYLAKLSSNRILVRICHRPHLEGVLPWESVKVILSISGEQHVQQEDS